MATEAFICDHVRTPRGRGRTDGTLHTMKPVGEQGADIARTQSGLRACDTGARSRDNPAGSDAE
jgi:hypothetical protein